MLSIAQHLVQREDDIGDRCPRSVSHIVQRFVAWATLFVFSKTNDSAYSSNTYGVDIDGQAVEIAKSSLRAKMSAVDCADQTDADPNTGRQPTAVSLDNIRRGNSLIGSGFHTRPQPEIADDAAALQIREFRLLPTFLTIA